MSSTRQPVEAQSRRSVAPITRITVIATVLPVLGSIATVSVAPFLADWFRGQGWLGVLYFTIAFAIGGALMLAPTYSTSVLAGWTFGFAIGFPAVIVGTIAGAALCYLGAAYLARSTVQATFTSHPKWELVRRALLEESTLKTLWIVFLLRLSPVLPFGTTNVLLATTGVHFGVYLLGTLLGLVPRTGLIAMASASAGKLDLNAPGSWQIMAAGIGATVVCIFVVTLIGKHALDRATRQSSPPATPVDSKQA
jgi:uncharacterized membrane protein YdjX (TVP38/TMEM64 family)